MTTTPDQPDDTRAETRTRLIDQFKDRYGSFESEQYLRDERTYKVRLAESARANLDQQQLARMIADKAFADAAQLIRRAYRRPENNLLNSWDRLPLENAPDEALALALYDLLYADEPFEARFTRWVAVLSVQTPNCWPAATFFLMLVEPQRQIFVKPTPFRSVLVRLHPELAWPTRPTAAAYRQLVQLADDLYAHLRPLGARDMIDVQSFIWAIQPEHERALWLLMGRSRSSRSRHAQTRGAPTASTTRLLRRSQLRKLARARFPRPRKRPFSRANIWNAV